MYWRGTEKLHARSVPLLVSLGDLHLAFTFILLMLVAIETRFNSSGNRDWMSFHKDWYLNEETFHLQ